jgi:ubiquinone/menaquinone biosynthesis C-methylase UbiE
MEHTTSHEPTRSAKAQFDRQAAHYNVQWNGWSEEVLNSMLELAQCQPQFRVLDVATGTGFTALAFAPFVHSVVGLDVSPGMLRQAENYAEERGIANASFQEGAAEALPFADETFCLVTCRIAPHHFLNPQKFLTETARVLKPGGSFVLADTTVPDDSAEAAQWQNAVEAVRDPSHVRNYPPSEWRQMAESAGLTVTECRTGGGGITIPLSDWLVRAGCTPEQSAEVRQHFADAPGSAREAFQIVTDRNGETVFTWQRVLLRAVK